MSDTATRMLVAERCCLVVIDPQEKLMRVIHKAEQATSKMAQLVNSFHAMDIPVITTTQYVKGLGPLVPEIAGITANDPTVDKLEFNAMLNSEFNQILEGLPNRIDSLVLCGVEAHICVYQTAAGATNAGYRVWVASDAVSSRDKKHVKDALKLISSFAACGPAEMIIYQLLQRAGTDRFKAVLPYIR